MGLRTFTMIAVPLILMLCIHGLHGQNTVFSFVSADNVQEDEGPREVCVRVAAVGTSPVDTTVNVTSVPNTAEPEDFSPQSASLFFAAADIVAGFQQCFNVTLTDDLIVESNENIEYTLDSSDPSVGVTLLPANEIIILFDDDLPIVNMTFVETSVSEGGDNVSICITYTGPAGGTDRMFQVQVLPISRTAIFQQDFFIEPVSPLIVMFPPGTQPNDFVCGPVEIVNDNLLNGNRRFQMMLEQDSTIIEIEPLITNVTIFDDDNATLTIQPLPPFVNEGETLVVCVTITGLPPGSNMVDIPVVLSLGGETSANDFNPPSVTLQVVIPMFQGQGCSDLVTSVDDLFEGNETLSISIESSDPLLRINTPPVSTIIVDAENVSVSFVAAQSSFSEDSGTVMVCIEMTNIPSGGTAVSLEVTVQVIDPTMERCNLQGNARLQVDYALESNSVTFPPYTSPPPVPNECLNITIINDLFAEENETFELELSSTDPSNALIQGITQTQITIVDEDIVTLETLSTASFFENEMLVSLLVSLGGPAQILERDINITVDDVPGTAEDPDDYMFSPIVLTFLCENNLPLTMTNGQNVSVIIVDDQAIEGNEDFVITYSSTPKNNVNETQNETTVTIIDDDFSAGFSFTELLVIEDVGLVQLMFAVIDGTPTRETLFTVFIGTTVATLGDDYSDVTSSFTLGPGNLQAMVDIRIINDTLTEADELLPIMVAVLDPAVTLINSTVNLTIDSDDISTISLRNITTAFENSTLQVCVDLEGSELGDTLTVELAAFNDTAIEPDDFVVPTDLLFVFAPFATESCREPIDIILDQLFEGFESFTISISRDSLEDVVIGTPDSLNITITNVDELQITIQPEMQTISEMSGSTNISGIIQVIPSNGLAVPVTLRFGFSMSSAELNTDFSISTDYLMFSTSAMFGEVDNILVTAIDDEILEGNEDVIFELLTDVSTLPGLTVSILDDTITIIDDEVIIIGFVNATLNFSETDGQVEVCIVPMSVPSSGFSVPINVSVNTVSLDPDTCSGSGSASDADFTLSSSNFVTFPPNSTDEFCVDIMIINDILTEGTESFSLQITVLSPPNIVTPGDPSVINILDDDSVTVAMAVSALSVDENSGNMDICAELTGNLCTEIAITVMNVDTAPAFLGEDYSFSGAPEITFLPGSITGSQSCVTIQIIDDLAFELEHSFVLELMSPNPSVAVVNAALDTTQITIIDNENVNASLSAPQLNVTEGESIGVTVVLELPEEGLQIPVTVELLLVFSGSASFADVSLVPMMVTFPVGMTDNMTVTLNAVADNTIEFSEMFTIQINQTALMPSVTATDPFSLNITIINIDGADLDFASSELFVQTHDEGTGFVEICFQLNNVPMGGSEVDINGTIATTDGLAIEGVDFIFGGIDVVFLASSTNSPVCIDIQIVNDSVFEPNHSFNVSVVSATPDQIIPTSDTIEIIIEDNENATFELPSGGRSVLENIGNTEVCITFTAPSGGLEIDVMIMVNPVPMSADATDFIDFATTLTFPSGTSPPNAMCFNITIVNDLLVEMIETFQVMLASSTSSRIEFVNNPLSVTVTSDDASVRFANTSFFASEGESPTICVEIFEGQLAEPAVVMISLSSSSATAGVDFMLSQMFITLGPDTVLGCAVFQITSDLIKEVNETVSLRLSSTENTIVTSNDTLNITIISNDIARISFVNSTIIRVGEAVGTIVLCAELNGASLSENLTVYTMIQGTPLAQLGSDYVPQGPSHLLFLAGSPVGTEECVNIIIIDDDGFELEHSFSVFLVDPGNPLCQIAEPSAVEVVIIDNENVTVSFDTFNTSILEGDLSTAGVVLTSLGFVQLEIDVVVNLTVSEGTGELDDIMLSVQSLTFMAGTSPPATLEFDITAVDDQVVEQDEETVYVSIERTAPYAVGTPSSIHVTVINIHGATIQFEQPSLMVDENSGVLPVCLEISSLPSNGIQDPFSISVDFVDDSAIEGEDFIVLNDLVVFDSTSLAGSTSCAMVSIIDDDVFEFNEVFQSNLTNSNFSTVNLSPTLQPTTITDNEVALFSVQPELRVLEDQNATVCVTLNGPTDGLGRLVSLNITTMNRSAIAPVDYQAVMGSVDFQAGALPFSEICNMIPIVDDLLIEGNEEFLTEITTSESRITIMPNSTVITIIDNDLRVQFLNESVNELFPENAAPTFTVCFNVTQGVPSFDHDLFLTADPFATAMMGSDYVIAENPLTINANLTSGCFVVTVLNDDFFENDDSVSFTLTTTSLGLQIVNGFLNLTILNDDFVMFEFNHSKYVVNETSDTQVCVRPVPGGGLVGPDVPMTVVLTIRNRTAFEGLDFSFDSGLELIFDGSSQIVCTPVTIFDDGIVEFSEYFVVLIEDSTEQVEVVIHDPDVCPNVETGPVCEDSIFLRVCNSLREMSSAVPRSCAVVLEEYDDVFYQP